MNSTAPRANSAHHGAILNILVSIQPSLEVSTAHPGSQFTLSTFQPLELGLLWSYRAVSTLTIRVKTTPILRA